MDSAIGRRKSLCEEESSAIVAKFGLAHYRGTDWCMITAEEGVEFGITLEEMPMIVAVYDAYMTIVNLCSSSSYPRELIGELRRELQWIGHGAVEQNAFVRLASLLGVRASTAIGFYQMQQRSDLATAKRVEALPLGSQLSSGAFTDQHVPRGPHDDLIPF